jgi:hypothetical protein
MATTNKTEISENRKTIINLVYGSLLLLFFIGLILFGPEKLPQYKHNLIAVISSLLIGIFGYFLTGEVGLKMNSTLFENKIGKIAIQASGGIALFILAMIWWRSPLAPIEKIESKIIKEQKEATRKTINAIDSSSIHLDNSIKNEGEKTRETVLDASIAELEGMFPLAVRIERDVDGGIVSLNGQAEIPIISYEHNQEVLKFMWGDIFHYYIFYKDVPEKNLGKIFIQLSNGNILPLDLSAKESSIRIPGSNPNSITGKFLNPDRLSGISIKFTVYSADRERGREIFKDALMKTVLSSRARKIYKELKVDGVRLRNSPNNQSKTIRTLKTGTYLKILKDSNSYSYIRLPEGREGWIKTECIGEIK